MMEAGNAARTRARTAVLALACCLMALVALALAPRQAHALFSMETDQDVSHDVRPFVVDIAVETVGELHSTQVDKGLFKVTITYSDGTTRVLEPDEFGVTPGEVAAGTEGEIEGDVTYTEGGIDLSGGFTLKAGGAYGAQYGDTLVFGRGIPADAYEGKALANSTWGFEEAAVGVNWNRGQLVTVVDVATVAPVSMASWFTGASALRSVNLDQIDTSHVTSFAHAFQNCSALTSLGNIGSWDTSASTNHTYMFRGCSSLVSLDLSRWNMAKSTNISFMFASCPNLTTPGNIGAWNVTSVQTTICMFQSCGKLNNVGNLGNWRTPSMRDIGNTFQGCSSLTSMGDLRYWDVSHVTNMQEVFHMCSKLTTIGDVSGWNTANVTNMYQTFQFCNVLQADCSKWNVSKVTNHTSFNANGGSGVRAPSWR